MPRIIGIIPARFASTRFPGKPLAKIQGKSLIQRTYENASRCTTLEDIIIATDDKRIYDHGLDFGAHVVMTSPDCLTGTDRLAEVIRKTPSLDSVEIIVNIQGDEPCLDPSILTLVGHVLEETPNAAMATAITPLKEEDALNTSVTKCVIDQKGYALYFSRALIPGGKNLKFNPSFCYYKHLGIYAYRREFLLLYSQLSPTPLQLAEDLEQLKVLEHGYKIATATVHGEWFDVNIPEDIQKVEKLLCKQNTSL